MLYLPYHLTNLSQTFCTNLFQRESSATIKAPPIAYQQASPPTRQKVIEFDCRGLEFTEFKSEVRACVQYVQSFTNVPPYREIG